MPAKRVACPFVLIVAAAAAAPALAAELASVNRDGDGAGNDFSIIPSEELRPFSTNGQFVAFTSRASDLVADDSNSMFDVFVRDFELGVTELISVNASGDDSGNGRSTQAQLSADGRFVLFISKADDLVANDTNAADDVFLHDRESGSTILISANASGTDSASGESATAAMTPDGRFVVFSSTAGDLGPTDSNGVDDIYLRDVETGTTELISVNSAGTGAAGGTGSFMERRAAISDDGRYVVFSSDATDLDDSIPDSNGVFDSFLRDRVASTTSLISTNSAGDASADDSTSDVRISADGSTIAIGTKATNILDVTDTNGGLDIYVIDRESGAKSLVSVNEAGTGTGNDSNRNDPRLSADGRFVAFESRASDLTEVADSNGTHDVFLRDLESGSTVLASIDSNGTASGNGTSEDAQISDDGRFVYFESQATDLTDDTDMNSQKDTFVFDSLTGAVHLVSVGTAGGVTGNDFSYDPVVSPGGRFVQMDSGADDLDPGVADTNTFTDVYVADIAEFVPNEDPAAGFATVQDGLDVDFVDTSTDADGTVLSWDWDFGDGSTSNERNPAHTYATTGNFTVSLAVTDNLGGGTSVSRDIGVGVGGGGGGGGGSSGPLLIGGLLLPWLLRGLRPRRLTTA